MPFAAVDHASHQRQGLARLPGVDRVGEVPRRDAAGLPEERFDVGRPDLDALAVRGPDDREDAVEASDVVAELVGDPGGGGAVEADAVLFRLGAHPRLAILGPIRRRRAHDVAARRLHAIGELLRQSPATGDEHELGRVERVVEVAEQRDEFVRVEAPDVAGHDHAPIGQERQCLRCVDGRAELVLVTVELVDHQAAFAVADEVHDEIVRLGAQDRLVVTGQQMDSHGDPDS